MLENKTIVVTGGSLGIGLAVSKKCADEGARVIIAARNRNDLEEALTELKRISRVDHQAYPLDVSRFEDVGKFAEWCSSNSAEINGLVNCAGIYGPIGRTDRIEMSEFRKTIEVNFLGTVYMCSTFAKLIKSDTRKKIVNYSGGGAASPFPNYSAYATSKIAIVRFTENLAIELADEGFDVNCVAPGFVITRLHEETIRAGSDSAGKNFFETTRKQIENGGVPAEKAAGLTALLLSSKSDGISGKFLSAPWDPWQEEDFQELLKSDKDFATLRRIDNKAFHKKS